MIEFTLRAPYLCNFKQPSTHKKDIIIFTMHSENSLHNYCLCSSSFSIINESGHGLTLKRSLQYNHKECYAAKIPSVLYFISAAGCSHPQLQDKVWTNQRPVFWSRDLSRPIKSQYSVKEGERETVSKQSVDCNSTTACPCE